LALFIAIQVCTAEDLKVGIIGLDTSHVPAFTDILNNKENAHHIPGAKVVGAFRGGSDDIEASYSRLDGYAKTLTEKYGVVIYPTIAELCKNVDVILLESLDGRKHLEQAEEVFKAGKRVFIDKPLGGNLKQCIEIYKLGKKYKVAWWSSSSLRYHEKTQQLATKDFGKIYSVTSQGPVSIEPTHTELFWYGVHTAEALYTILGPGCEEVTRVQDGNTEIVVGKWSEDRMGTFIGHKTGKAKYKYHLSINAEKGYAFEETGSDYGKMMVDIMKFFKTGDVPIPQETTLEIMAFMEAADESKQQGYKPVKIADVLKKHGL
jgi:predicted dehydrogenase